MPYYAYSTYIQTRAKQIGIKKTNKKGTNNPETKKNYTKIENVSQKYVQKGYMTAPAIPKFHYVLIKSRGATTKNKNTKIQNKEN